MKTVAIIGAGPSGLVAAKTFLRSKKGQYDVRIFEKTADVGGLWAVYKDRPYDGMLNPEMPTNLSRFNIGFSDLSWSSIGLEGHVPFWPRAWQVGQYLRAYVEKYIPPDVISFNSRVTSADMHSENGKSGTGGWKLRWESVKDARRSEQEQVFDHLVIATGLFSASSMPQFDNASPCGIKIIHSSKLRKLRDVAPDDVGKTGTLLVVGGGMSGGDAATVLANQLSDAVHSPTSKGEPYSGLKLVQLCSEAAYALPLAAPVDSPTQLAPEFLPLDLVMYDLSRRPPGDIELNVGKMPLEVIETVHKSFRRMVGDQSGLNAPGLRYDATSKAPYVTLTEQYPGFIRSGNIQVVTGRLTDLVTSGLDRARALISTQGQQRILEDIVGVVYATGFSPQPALDFLGPKLQEALDYDPRHNRLPIILDEYSVLSQGIPGFAVIGYHEGAFWGSMEMESRLIEQRWSQESAESAKTNEDHRTRLSQKPQLTDLRVAMNQKETDVPQYWMGDYVGLMETISRETGLRRNDFDWPTRTGPVTTYRYLDPEDSADEAAKSLEEFNSILHRSKTEAMFTPRAAFLAMQGNWNISRHIESALETMPSGQLAGLASFHPRRPTDGSYDFEYLYTERGTFRMNNGMTMQATRQYAYRYRESTDHITVWFVKGDGKTVDYLYHGLTFDVKTRQNGWLAQADHLCVADMYKSNYHFQFQGANLATFSITHAVKGPKKNYVSETKYSR